jgi:hypothetical protein
LSKVGTGTVKNIYSSATQFYSAHVLLQQILRIFLKFMNNEYSSVLGPDPHGSALILVGWIRIWIQEGKNDPQKYKKFRNFMFELLAVLLHSRAEGFSCG